MLLCDGVGIMIDQGVGIRKLKKHINEYALPLDAVQAILLTHDHFDHSRSVGETSELLGVPVYAHSLVHDAMLNNPHIYKKIPSTLRHDIGENEILRIGCFTITPFPVPHDSACNMGYFIETPQTNICLITDVGCYLPHIKKHISQSRNLVIEANYDTNMLASGKYPAMLKRRIAAEHGHASNQQTADVLCESLSPVIQRIFLCHLSANNNNSAIALQTIRKTILKKGFDIPVSTLSRTSSDGIFELY